MFNRTTLAADLSALSLSFVVESAPPVDKLLNLNTLEVELSPSSSDMSYNITAEKSNHLNTNDTDSYYLYPESIGKAKESEKIKNNPGGQPA